MSAVGSSSHAYASWASLAQMRQATQAIVQAPLVDGNWRGRADVLRRVETPSELGACSYEVVATKLFAVDGHRVGDYASSPRRC